MRRPLDTELTPLDPAAMRPEQGHCYVVELPGEVTGTLFEDGAPLGLADSRHDDIRQRGRGQYSFWPKTKTTLYFSTSDNSDPRRNGRRYAFSPAIEPAPAQTELLLHLEDEEFNRFYTAARARCGEGPRDRHYTLKELLLSLGRLEADTAECGVFFGLGSATICHYAAQLERKPGFRHHCFDSFAGLSRPTPADVPGRADVRAWHEGDMVASLTAVRKNLATYPWVEYHAGWIPACFDAARDAKFSFVHIDVDLYEPTRDALAFFYPRTVAGGIILFDDYGFLTCPGARQAVDERLAGAPERLVKLTTGQAYLTKRARPPAAV